MVVLISIIMSVIVTSFGNTDRAYELRGYIERLALRIEMARDRAIQTNHEWGVFVEREGLSFAEYDPVSGEWLSRDRRPFNAETIAQALYYKAKVESYAGTTGGDEENLPDIILFSSGETTPFEISIEPESQKSRWKLESDGFSRTEVSQLDRL